MVKKEQVDAVMAKYNGVKANHIATQMALTTAEDL